jgi:4-hydroxybutyryl-CoA dehydratase / vinylacetyl-CoA-Delta-isomerase
MRAMALRTADNYLDSIRARQLRVFYRGERMESVVDHPVAAPAARCVAEVYRAALDPATRAMMATESEMVGQTVNVSNILWRSREDLIARVKWERLIGRMTGRGALRSPGLDAINALAAVTFRCDRERGTGYHQRLLAFVARIQREDLAVSGAMTDVRGDRSKRPALQADPDLFLRVVSRERGGVVLRGAKAHQTSAVHCHEHVVLPMTCAADEGAWAIACAVPSDAPGITHIYARQPSDSRRAEGLPLDAGLPAFGGCESLMIFDDVFVPDERIFLDGETEYTQELVRLFGSFHRFCYGGCKVGIADVVIGAASLAARTNGVRDRSAVEAKLTEMVHLNETMYACGLAAALEGTPTDAGTWIPDIGLANVTKLNVTRFPFEIARLAADLAGGAMLTLPSQADLDHPELGPAVRKYLAGAPDVPTAERMAIFRLLEFLTHGAGAVYFLHESLHGAGAPEAMRILLRREIPLTPFEDAARHLLAR